jgi:subtilisin family serine protease
MNNNKLNLWNGRPVREAFPVLQKILGTSNVFLNPESPSFEVADNQREKGFQDLNISSKQLEAFKNKLNQIIRIKDELQQSADDQEFEQYVLLNQAGTFNGVKDLILSDGEIKINNWGILTNDGLSIEQLRDRFESMKNEIDVPESIDWKKVILGVLGGLIMMALIFFLFKKCTEEKEHVDDDGKENRVVIPDNSSTVMPFDSTQIVIDNTTPLKRKIVDNQLNVFVPRNIPDSLVREDLSDVQGIEIKGYDKNYNHYKLIILDPSKREEIKTQIQNFQRKYIVIDETIFNRMAISDYNDTAWKGSSQNYWYFNRIGAFKAWDKELGNPDMVVAVIDHGFDLEHEELKGKIFKPWSVWNGSPNITNTSGLDHGTHIAATIAGGLNNSKGISGICPSCRIMPVDVGDENGNLTFSSIIKGIMYAKLNGAQVLNLSIASMIFEADNWSMDEQMMYVQKNLKEEEQVWKMIFERIAQEDIAIVQAAGNNNALTALDPMKRDTVHTLIVGATNQLDERANFSSYGNEVRLSAPGTNIYNASLSNTYNFKDGTSMASPIVSAAMALMKCSYPDMNNDEIIKKLRSTGKPVSGDIGPIIRIDKALDADTLLSCDEEIAILKQKIEELKARLIDSEKLRIPESNSNISFAEGKWISTTNLVNTRTEEPVSLYIELDQNGDGNIKIIENNGIVCNAGINAALDNKEFRISQTSNAVCDDGEMYVKYDIVCVGASGEVANCYAVSQDGTFSEVSFQLKRID